MFRALKSDLNEFVSTLAEDIKEDTSNLVGMVVKDNARLLTNDRRDSNDDTSSTADYSSSVEKEEDYGDEQVQQPLSSTSQLLRSSAIAAGSGSTAPTPQEELIRRLKHPETFLQPLLPHKKVEVMSVPLHRPNYDDDDDDDDDYYYHRQKEDGNNGLLLCENTIVVVQEELYDKDDPVRKEIIEFLNSFRIDDMKDEICAILEEEEVQPYGSSANNTNATVVLALQRGVQKHHQMLVPCRVSYQDFWTRFFYRCDPQRIQREWENKKYKPMSSSITAASVVPPPTKKKTIKKKKDTTPSQPRSPDSIVKDLINFDFDPTNHVESCMVGGGIEETWM